MQEKVIAELTGSGKIHWRFYIVPGMGLEVGPDALAALERSANVGRVYEDGGLTPSLEKIKIIKTQIF